MCIRECIQFCVDLYILTGWIFAHLCYITVANGVNLLIIKTGQFNRIVYKYFSTFIQFDKSLCIFVNAVVFVMLRICGN